MLGTYDYPAKIEWDEDDRIIVTFPDFGWGATDGATLDEALAEARDLLRELMAQTMREGRPLPAPSRKDAKRYLVAPPIQIALKAALYDACAHAGASARHSAEDPHGPESEARHLLDPDRAASAAELDDALLRLGKRTTIAIDSFPANADASSAYVWNDGKEHVGGVPAVPECTPERSKMEVYAKNLGILMQNLFTLELIARQALDRFAGVDPIDLSQAQVDDYVEIGTLSNWDSLEPILNQYNAKVSKKYKNYQVDVGGIVKLRHALAHGRTYQCGPPDDKVIKLLRFGKPQRDAKKVSVTMSVIMDESWFSKNNNLLSQSIIKVMSASERKMNLVR